MSRRGAGLVVSLALGGCASAHEQILERDVLNEHWSPLPVVREATVRGPERPMTVAAVDLDRALPALEAVAVGDLGRDAGRVALRHDSTLEAEGLEGVDLEVGPDRWFAEKRNRPTGTVEFRGTLPSGFVAWRGPAAVDDLGRLQFFCFEGELRETSGPQREKRAEASSAYRVDAEPIVPGVIWAFRSGRPDAPSHAVVVDRDGHVIPTPEPCDGVERVEFIGPSAFWIVGSMDPRDAIALPCAVDGGCPFARVAVPLVEGSLTSALLMSDEPKQREHLSAGPQPANVTKFGGAPPHADVFEYTFELDWSHPTEGIFGHVIIAASAVPAVKLGPGPLRGRR